MHKSQPPVCNRSSQAGHLSCTVLYIGSPKASFKVVTIVRFYSWALLKGIIVGFYDEVPFKGLLQGFLHFYSSIPKLNCKMVFPSFRLSIIHSATVIGSLRDGGSREEGTRNP